MAVGRYVLRIPISGAELEKTEPAHRIVFSVTDAIAELAKTVRGCYADDR